MNDYLSLQLAKLYDPAYTARVIGWVDRIPQLQRDRRDLMTALLETESPSKERLDAVMADCEPPQRPLYARGIRI